MFVSYIIFVHKSTFDEMQSLVHLYITVNKHCSCLNSFMGLKKMKNNKIKLKKK